MHKRSKHRVRGKRLINDDASKDRIGEAGQLKRRLEQGVLPREILEADFKDLIVKVSDNEPIEITAVAAADVAKVGGKTKEEAHDFDLALTADNTEYKVDDQIGRAHV